jgi:hypothetical protein
MSEMALSVIDVPSFVKEYGKEMSMDSNLVPEPT